MAATVKNYVYEVDSKEEKIMSQPSISKSFVEECKKVAQKYCIKNTT